MKGGENIMKTKVIRINCNDIESAEGLKRIEEEINSFAKDKEIVNSNVFRIYGMALMTIFYKDIEPVVDFIEPISKKKK
jgi:hypothetical protein